MLSAVVHAQDQIADLCQVQAGTVSAIVIISVHVQNLLALYGQESGENALGEASTEHDDLGRGCSEHIVGTT